MNYEEFIKEDSRIASEIAAYETENCRCQEQIAINNKKIVGLKLDRQILRNEFSVNEFTNTKPTV